MSNKLKIGVVGAGHLGKAHIKNLLKIPEVDFIGFFDNNLKQAKKVSREFKVKSFESLASLLKSCDGISIVVPTSSHYEVTLNAIKQNIHIFCEKPFMSTLEQSQEIIKAAQENNIILQVGHIERFNPALTSLRSIAIKPLFIESHRISPFNIRGTDVAVILDLMIHDIDIILSLVKQPIKNIEASGTPVLSNNIDIANARISFENGCVANVTASRISQKKMRKLRIFQLNSYIAIDFMQNSTEIFRLGNKKEKVDKKKISIAEVPISEQETKKIFYQKIEAPKTNALYEELKQFVNSIKTGARPYVTGEEASKALEVALQIESQIKNTLKNFYNGYT